MADTRVEYDNATTRCRDLYERKLGDYGASWRIMRPKSVTDQIFIKAKRIRTLELNSGITAVGDGIEGEYVAIVNYGVIGLIQLELGVADESDLTVEEAVALYDKYLTATRDLMLAKNSDYGEAWRSMRITSLTDIILTKVERAKQIEDNRGVTAVSEGVGANYQDMINYAVFALIKLGYGQK